jgi:hypothetical protein
VARWETRNTYGILILTGKLIGKRPVVRTRMSWEDNIQINLRKMSCEERGMKEQAQDSVHRRSLILLGSCCCSVISLIIGLCIQPRVSFQV